MSAVKGEEITEGVPEKGSNEYVQMKDASVEAVSCSVLSGCLLRLDVHRERRQQFPTNRSYPSSNLEELRDPSILCYKYFK